MENKEENLDNQIGSTPTDSQPVIVDIDENTSNAVTASEDTAAKSVTQYDTNQPVGISSSYHTPNPTTDTTLTETINLREPLPTAEPQNITVTTPNESISNTDQPPESIETTAPLPLSPQSTPKIINQSEPQVIIKERILEIPVEKIVEKEVIREIPIEKIVYKEIPVEKIVEKIVTKEIPVDRIIEKVVMVFDEEKFKEEIKKRAMSLLQKALQNKKNKRDQRLNRVLEYINAHKSATTGEIQAHLRISPMTVHRYTNVLIHGGKIRFEGKRRSRVYISL